MQESEYRQPDKPSRRASNTANRQQRRRVGREIRRLVHADICSFCQQHFSHNTQTFAGIDDDGRVVIACEQCCEQVAVIVYGGLVLNKNYDFITPTKRRSSKADVDIEKLIGSLRQLVGKVDAQVGKELKSSVGRQATVEDIKNIGLLDSKWKDDDRIWFKQHIDRSHRVRALYPGEFKVKDDIPEGHQLTLVVRQLKPGVRFKLGIILNEHFLPVPDSEAIAHALFDIAATAKSGPIDEKQVFALIERYRSISKE